MVGEESSFRKRGGLRGERISRLATAPFFYTFSLPSVESQPARKTDTVPSFNIMTLSLRPTKHMIALGRRAANTLLVRTGERTRKYNQRETTYITVRRKDAQAT